jgi:subtilisin family serine protease
VHAGSPEVVVAVIDSGFDLSHPELQSRMWINSREIPDNGIDDDGNGMLICV